MALLLEKTLYNGDVTRYHRITEYSIDSITNIVTAKLSSFRNKLHRGLPTAPVSSIDFTFLWSGNSDTLANEAYAYIKSLPEWSLATDDL